MDPINGINSIVENLRRELARNERKTNTSRAVTHDSAAAAPRDNNKKITQLQLRAKLSERIRQLDSHAEDYYKKATNLILESIVTREFGDRILNDPHFSDIIFRIHSAIEENSEISSELKELIRELHDPVQD